MMTIKKKRRNPADLVASAGKSGSWYSQLKIEDKNYVDDVVKAMAENPWAAPQSVASKLVEELGLEVTSTAVVNKLKAML